MEGRGGPALERYRLAIQADPAYTEARWSLAAALIESGRIEEGRRELEELLRRQPAHAEARELLGRLPAR